ncbi:MAG TPA: class I SAM-dependent RNA methyltransferase, partial [Burkholderiaceae bacterium]
QLPEGMPGTLMMNPPYGERIEVRGKAGNVTMSRDASGSEQRDTDDEFFPRLAAHWKRGYTGDGMAWTAWMLSPDMKLPNKMRLKESRRVPMWNGPIECRLFKFDLVKGSAREKRAPSAEA